MMMVNVYLSIRMENSDLGSFLCCQNLHKIDYLLEQSYVPSKFLQIQGFFQHQQTYYDKLHISTKHSLIFLSNVNRSNEFMFD